MTLRSLNRKTRLALIATALGALAVALALILTPAPAEAKPATNLKVLPKGMEKKAVKKIMKKWAKALGVKCNHCHDMDDMAVDTKKKKQARKMYKMVKHINARHLKKYKAEVTCRSCHQGAEEPKK